MRKAMLFFILTTISLLLTSCWSRREIDQLGFVLGIGISKTDTGLYSVIAQIANANIIVAEAPDQRSVYTILEAEGLTIFDALRNLSLVTGRRLYIGHLKALILDESVAKEGLGNIIGFLVQDMEVRLEIKVFVSQIPPAEILDTPNTLGLVPSLVLDIQAENYGANSKIFVSDLHQTAESVSNPSANLVTALIEKKTSPTDKEMEVIKLTKIAVFDNDRLKGYLDYEEGQSYNFITNKFKNGLIVFHSASSNDQLTIEILESKAEISPTYENGEVIFDISLKVTGNVAERIPPYDKGHEIDLAIETVQKELDHVLEEKLRSAVDRAQNVFEVDYYNLSKQFAKRYPTAFKGFKNDWNTVFSSSQVRITAESQLIHSALSTNRGKI